jgi:hypothetical protein
VPCRAFYRRKMDKFGLEKGPKEILLSGPLSFLKQAVTSMKLIEIQRREGK